jgi:two-component system, chemotaxis family, sensor kinase CheA
VSNASSRQVDPELFRLFRQDGRQYLSLLRRTLQQAGGESLSTEDRRRALRYAHSVKSEAAFLGYTSVARLAHRLEDALSGRATASLQEMLGTLGELEFSFDEALEGARGSVPALSDTEEDEGGPAEVVLSEALTPRDRDMMVEARERGERLFVLECELTEHAQMLMPRRYLLTSNLEEAVNVVASHPPADSEAGTRRFAALFTLEGDRSVAEHAVDVDQVKLLRLEEADYDAILRRKDETLVSGMIAGTDQVRVEMSTRSYEELCLYAGELHRQLDQLRDHLSRQETSDSRIAGSLRTASRLAESVDDTIARTSMVPLSGVLGDVEQHARDLAGFLGKSVRVITAGGSHEVFLPVSHVLRDVLLHLVRNAVDHGVEFRGERRRRGKDPVATLRVFSREEGDDLVIRVSDDGRGIRVGSEGGAKAAQAGSADSRELWDLVSRSGMSTRKSADELSGRGVGLDVVRTQVERYLGGRVELETEANRGTTVGVRLPRAGQLVSVLIARHGRTEFALPSAHVFAVFDLEARHASRDRSGNLFYRYHGEAIRLYAVERSAIPATVEGYRGILLRIGRRRAVVLAGEIVSQETVIRNASTPDQVFSQALNRDVGLVFPIQFL